MGDFVITLFKQPATLGYCSRLLSHEDLKYVGMCFLDIYIYIYIFIGLSPLPVTVANEGLGWDPRS